MAKVRLPRILSNLYWNYVDDTNAKNSRIHLVETDENTDVPFDKIYWVEYITNL